MSDFVLRTYLRLSEKAAAGDASPADLTLLDAVTAELRQWKRAWLLVLDGAQ